jgi:hypothetical protein
MDVEERGFTPRFTLRGLAFRLPSVETLQSVIRQSGLPREVLDEEG